jgi:ATP-binding cassette subfamily F protein uup
MEKKEWETIEDDIAKLEEQMDLYTEEMNHQGDNFTKLQELQHALTETEKLLDEKMERWAYLSELADE